MILDGRGPVIGQNSFSDRMKTGMKNSSGRRGMTCGKMLFELDGTMRELQVKSPEVSTAMKSLTA